MAGILDLLMGNNAAASPWGALYPTQSGLEADQAQQARDAAAAVLARRMRGGPGVEAAPALPDFGAGATPFGFAGPGSMTGINPAMLAPPAAPAPAAPIAQAPAAPSVDLSSVNRTAPAPAAPDEGPDSFVPVGKYQMPMFGEPGDAPQAAAPGAGPPAAALAPGAPSPAAPFSLGGVGAGIGDRFMKGTRGFLGNMAAGPLGALAGGLGAIVTGQETDPTSIANQKLNMTAQALLQKGASLPDVQAAAQNPTLMQSLIQQYYGKDKYKVQQTGENGLGGKTFKLFNETDGTFKDIPGSAAGTGGDGMPAGIGDMTKTGPAYLATVPQAQQGTVQGMVDGTIQPPTSMAAAKPYWQTMIAAAKRLDPTFDENNWSARHKMSIDYAASGNSTMGGILSNGKSAFEHLKVYSDKLADVGNYNGPDVPGGAAIADVGNLVGNRLLPTAATLGKISGANSAGLKYGQESTKFYAGSGGGEGERTAALHNNDARSTTGAAQAGFLQTEKELMLGRLREKENQLRDTMGEGFLQRHPVMTPQIQQTIAAIDANIAKLRGQGGGSAPAAPGAAPTARGGTVNVGGKPISWSVN